MPTVHYRTADVGGLKISYREAGRPNAPTLLLLHGFPTAGHMFRDLIPLLAESFHLVAPDLPGFGQSDLPARDAFKYSFENLANAIDRFTEVLGANLNRAVRTSTGGDPRIEANRDRHHEPVVVIGVFADQVDPPRRPEDRRTRVIRTLEVVGQQLCGRFVAGRRARHSHSRRFTVRLNLSSPGTAARGKIRAAKSTNSIMPHLNSIEEMESRSMAPKIVLKSRTS